MFPVQEKLQFQQVYDVVAINSERDGRSMIQKQTK